MKAMDKEEKKAFQHQVSTAILQLRQRSPFFATLVLFAHIIPAPEYQTAGTDGRDIFISPQFWQHLTTNERLGLLTHEVLHAALLHVSRQGTRNPSLWNIAADIVVNGIILTQEGFTLPIGYIRNQELEHLSVEEIYSLLKSQPDLQKKFHLQFADLLNISGRKLLLPDEYVKQEQIWKEALQQARTLVEMQGQGADPTGLAREMRHHSPPQLDWRTYLWRFLVQTPTDFQGFDRRFIGQRLYLDTLENKELRVFLAIDTSGSINREEMKLFMGEVQAILGSYPQLRAMLYYTDSRCYGPYELTASSEIPQPEGGGGTDFRPFFQAIETETQDANNGICIYLTDGYGIFPPDVPILPVLWVLVPGGIDMDHIPFGETVRLLPDV